MFYPFSTHAHRIVLNEKSLDEIFLSYNSPHGQIWKITDDEWTFEEMFLSYNPPGWWRGLHTVLASHPNLARCSVPGEETIMNAVSGDYKMLQKHLANLVV